jgi:uncharacterized protein (TIGR02246 family)
MVTANVRQEVEQAVRQFEAHFNRGDMTALAGMYTENATLLPPDSDLIQGRQGIQQFWQGAQDSGIRQARLEVQEVQASGELAVEISYATLTVQPDGGQASEVRLKYIVVWQRTDGSWQLRADIWNSTAPA